MADGANNPTSSNPLIKKIASDMSFIYMNGNSNKHNTNLKRKVLRKKKNNNRLMK